LARKAQSDARDGIDSKLKHEFGSGCLRYFQWSSVAVEVPSGSVPPQRSGSFALNAQFMFVFLVTSCTVLFL
jgi:hypothetical protein